MSLTSSTIINGDSCSCEFELVIYQNELVDTIDLREGLRMKVNIRQICNMHKQNSRTKFMQQLKKNNNPDLIEQLTPALTDLSYDIKTN